MSLLTIAQGLALNVGMVKPDQVIGAPGREWAEVLQLANETGEELARRVQWGDLTRTAQIGGFGRVDLPEDFDRLVDGVCVRANGRTVRPLSRAEWNDLPASEGQPRYFLLEDTAIRLWPEGEATVIYQSRAWIDAGTAVFTADSQSPLMDEALFLKGLIVRWRRQKGMSYQDEEAEYESTLADYARADDRRAL